MFRNKVAVITGAGAGIGRALAQQLAARGARLALSDVSPAALDDTMRRLSPDCEARAYALDVSSRQAFFAHADDVLRDFGAVHYVFNNAGATMVGTIEHLDIDEIEWQLGVNLWGVIYGTKAFLPSMLTQREGCIVNISSVFGLLTFPAQGAYNIAKFGVRALTECLWSELEGSGVRAVCVHPGGIRTDIEKAGRRCRVGGPDEAAFAAKAQKMLKTPPEICAADILDGIERGRKRILTGHRATTMYWMSRLFPDTYPALLRRLAA